MKIRIIEQDTTNTWVVVGDANLERIPTKGEKILLPSSSIKDGLDIHEVVDIVFRENYITEVYAKVIGGQQHYNKYVRK